MDKTMLCTQRFVCVWTTAMIAVSLGYPGGVPDLACESMFPIGHQSPASGDPPPYKIALTKLSYKPGETVKVTIQSTNGEYFSGLYVQARLMGCNVNSTHTLGVFTSTNELVETRHCFGKIRNAISHTSAMGKISVTFYWTAPVVSGGHVVMRATIVKSQGIFWTGVESSPLIDLHDKDMLYCVDSTGRKNKIYKDRNKNKMIIPETNDSMRNILSLGNENLSHRSTATCTTTTAALFCVLYFYSLFILSIFLEKKI